MCQSPFLNTTTPLFSSLPSRKGNGQRFGDRKLKPDFSVAEDSPISWGLPWPGLLHSLVRASLRPAWTRGLRVRFRLSIHPSFRLPCFASPAALQGRKDWNASISCIFSLTPTKTSMATGLFPQDTLRSLPLSALRLQPEPEKNQQRRPRRKDSRSAALPESLGIGLRRYSKQSPPLLPQDAHLQLLGGGWNCEAFLRLDRGQAREWQPGPGISLKKPPPRTESKDGLFGFFANWASRCG
uniref:uncharacterized protein LOC114598848 n=1 Tax=Podarcis muralis TaxID=64176 RepID=UPI00109F1A3B|nr:uncharacterized protein LOC114598848 [Podarcis muralis]